MDVKQSKPPAKAEKLIVKPDTKKKAQYITYGIVACCFLLLYCLLQFRFIQFPDKYETIIEKLVLSCLVGSVILFATRLSEMLIVKHYPSRTGRYNIIRLIRFISMILLVLVVISFLFKNWYAAAFSLGLVSLILGFALQTPITSLIGWFYILLRSPYKVGDRIELNSLTGDVVEIGYLDTTLWEVGSHFLSSEIPSGRLIRFPNSLVLQSATHNYSWKKFPYIWNEISVTVPLTADLAELETKFKAITKSQLKPDIADNVKKLKNIIAQTPVDELEIKEYPYVNFKLEGNSLNAVITYLVEPHDAASTRNNIVKKILPELSKLKHA